MKTPHSALNQKKAFLTEMRTHMDELRCAAVWQDAEKRLGEMYRRYPDLPKGVRMHTHRQIFPTAAVYLALRDACGQETAFAVLKASMREHATKTGALYAKMTRVPGFRTLFLQMWDKMSHAMFSDSAGFCNVFYPKAKGAFRMDITACPYHHYTAELGCPEINPLFCQNDVYSYGSIPGVEFSRTQTLGDGGEKCDFYLRLKK